MKTFRITFVEPDYGRMVQDYRAESESVAIQKLKNSYESDDWPWETNFKDLIIEKIEEL